MSGARRRFGASRGPGAPTWVLSSLALVAAAAACHPESKAPPPSEEDLVVAELTAYEDARHASADFTAQASSNRVLGPDPYALAALSRKARTGSTGGSIVGLLRGAERVVLLDDDLVERARAEAPPLASAIAVSSTGEVLAGGEGSSEVMRLRVRDGRLELEGTLDVRAGDPRRTVRALATHPSGTVYAADEARDAVVVARPGLEPYALSVPRGPIRLYATPRFLAVASLSGHALSVFRLDASGTPLGEPTIVRHDGPFWSLAAVERGADLLVAAGGVEDHALDRRGGSFAYIDSYLYLYRIREEGAVTRLSSINLGERGVVTPKALAFTEDGRGLRVLGYASSIGLDLVWPGPAEAPDYGAAPSERSFAAPPGASALLVLEDGATVIADPLADVWVKIANGRAHVTPSSGDLRALPRTDGSRLGEALFFTTLMSPWAKSDGPLSRFTCETCHFEGGVDGRTHHTGRGEIVATTKPLFGLFNDAPYFTRALDKNMAAMVHAEFRVAAQNTGRSPWFSLDQALQAGALGFADDASRPFIDLLVTDRARFDGSPKGLRKSLMELLMDLSHRPNPAALGRDRFDWLEGEGARVFEETCVSCHAPRLVANDPATTVRFEDWERLVLGTSSELVPGSIVWARDGYEKTGVEPYVHPEGARPTSLRRLARKRPYFTNGSAETLDEVLDRARSDGDRFWHDAARAPASASLRPIDPDARVALRAFLELL